MNPSKSYRNRLILTVTLSVLLLLWISTVESNEPQMIVVGCSRKIIESYPKPQSKPVLRLLDESRSMTDEFMSAFSKGDPSEIHRRYPQLEVWFNKDSQGGKQLQLPAVFSIIGAPIRFDYRSDEALYSLSRPQIEPRGRFSTLYWLGTSKAGGNEVDGHFLLIVETRIVDEERKVTSAIVYGDWAHKQFSGERSGTKCAGMESGLRIETY